VIFVSRLIAALAYAGAAFLFGLVLGERGELGIVQHLFVAAIPAATVVMTIFAKKGRIWVLLTGAAMLCGLILGQRQFDRAWSECLTGGYAVRDRLVRFHAQNDGYPARLEDLDIELPCRCGFRRTILHYLSNDRGFRLWMTNDREMKNFGRTERRSPQTP
jgi:hypothetical protein